MSIAPETRGTLRVFRRWTIVMASGLKLCTTRISSSCNAAFLFCGAPVTSAGGWRSEERRVGKECRYWRDWSSDVCSSDLYRYGVGTKTLYDTDFVLLQRGIFVLRSTCDIGGRVDVVSITISPFSSNLKPNLAQ